MIVCVWSVVINFCNAIFLPWTTLPKACSVVVLLQILQRLNCTTFFELLKSDTARPIRDVFMKWRIGVCVCVCCAVLFMVLLLTMWWWLPWSKMRSWTFMLWHPVSIYSPIWICVLCSVSACVDISCIGFLICARIACVLLSPLWW